MVYQGLIHLYGVQWDIGQVTKTTVSCSKVIQMKLDASFYQTVKDFLCLLTLLKKDSLRNFQNHILMGNLISIQLIKKILHKIIIIDLIAAEVYGDRTKSMPLFLPLCQLPNYLFHGNFSQLHNISVAFRHGDKLIRRTIFVSNSHKRLKAHNFSALTVYLRLIYHIEGILLNSIFYLFQNLADFFLLIPKFLTVEYQSVFSLSFCEAHGQTGIHYNRSWTFSPYRGSNSS